MVTSVLTRILIGTVFYKIGTKKFNLALKRQIIIKTSKRLARDFLNINHNISHQTNLSALHTLTVLSRVRGGAPSWRGADVVRLQPSSVAFVRNMSLCNRKRRIC